MPAFKYRKRWLPPMREFKNVVAVAVQELPNGSVTDIFHSVRRRCPEWPVTPHRVRKALVALQRSQEKQGKKQNGSNARSSSEGASRAFPHDIVELRSSASRSRHAQWQWRGQVLRVAGYDHGEAADDETHELPRGHCSVFWLGRHLEQWSNKLTSCSSIRVIDRPWVLGDRVARADDPLSLGHIVGVRCSLVLSDSSTSAHAPVQTVRAVGGFRAEDWVASEACRWVGKVEEAVFRVEVELCSGKGEAPRLARGRRRRKPATCAFQVSSEGLQGLEPARGGDVTPQELSPHFPGQQVRAPARLWRQAEWLHGGLGRRSPRRGSTICGVVTSVECCLLAVRWLAGLARGSRPPDEWIAPDAVRTLCMPNSSEGWAIGDHVQAGPDSHAPAAVVVESRTVVDVQWADGTVELNVPSLRLCPRPHVSAHDFLPRDFVSRSGESDQPAPAPGLEVVGQVGGAPLPTNALLAAITGATAALSPPQHQQHQAEAQGNVAMDDANMYSASPYSEYEVNNDNINVDVEVYDLNQEAAERLEQIVPTGTVVVTQGFAPLGVVTSVNLQARTAVVQWVTNSGAARAGETEEVSVFELTDHPQVDIRLGDAVLVPAATEDGRWAGRVCGLTPEGQALVRVLDGSSKHFDVRSLVVVDDGEGSESNGGDEGSADEEGEYGEWTAQSQQDNSDGDEWEEARADPESEEEEEAKSCKEDMDVDEGHADVDEDAKSPGSNREHAGSSCSSTAAAAPAVAAEVLPFDVCDDDIDPADHFFAQQPTLGTRALMMAVRREMVVLRKGLLEGSEGVPAPIIVRTFSSRSDLFRAMVVGPPETPYAHVPFFFDLALPADYPREPPRAHFHAHLVGNERLNPNLYVDGKVCLSLLGTWSGPAWDPQRSTLLQVLVSLQGLVLVEEPYYNEPGHECDAGTEQGKQASALYNEHARLLALRAALNVAQSPPRGFAEIVASFFARFGPKLVAECEDILCEPKASQSSEGFRKVLAKTILPRLRDRWGTPPALATTPAPTPALSPQSEAAPGPATSSSAEAVCAAVRPAA